MRSGTRDQGGLLSRRSDAIGGEVVSTPSGRDRPARLAFAVAMGWLWVAFGWHALSSSVVVDGERYFILSDDALISMRYADNLAQGLGLVWNRGERVEGYSNLLWTLWMSVLHLLPVPKSKLPLLLGVSACGLVSWAMFSLRTTMRRVLESEDGPPNRRVAVLESVPALLLVTSMPLLSWTFSGLELPLLVLLTTLLLDQYVQWIQARDSGALRRIAWRIGGGLGLGLLVRDDYVTVCVATFVALALATWRRGGPAGEYASLGLIALVPLMVKTGHLVIRHEYYGFVVPNTYAQKVAGWPLPERWRAGADYVAKTGSRLLVFMLPIVVYLWKRRRSRVTGIEAVCVYALVVATVLGAYAAHVGGDALGKGRLFLTAYPALFCATVLASYALGRRSRRPEAVVVALLTMLFLLSGDHARAWGSGIVVHDQSNAAWNIVVARYLAGSHPRARVGVFWAGGVPYYSGLEAIDLLGLNDRVIASGPYRGTKRAPGHGKYDYEYVFGQRRPDVIVGPFERYKEVADYERMPEEVMARMRARAEVSDYPFAPALFANQEFLTCYHPNRATIPSALLPPSKEISMPPVYVRCPTAAPGKPHCGC